MQRSAFGARRFPTRKQVTVDPYANPSTLFSHVLTLPTVARAPKPSLEACLTALPAPPPVPQWSGATPHSDSVPPSPTHGGFPTDEVPMLAPGSSSTIHKTVLKRPAIATLHVDGTRVTNGADVARQFAAELRVLRTVSAAGAHPNIVGFVGALDGLGIVLEWIDGATLFERITLGRAAEDRLALSAMLEGAAPGGSVSTFRTARAVVAEQERLVWCDEVLSALCFVHSLGLTHGDVNTLNVLIVPSRALHGRAFGRAKLIDFGRSTAVGKHEYAAPCARPFCAPEITRAWDRAMRGASIVHERRSRSKSRSRGLASGETTPRASVASRFPPSNSHTPSCTTPCTPTASSGTLPLCLDADPPSLSSSLSSVSSLSDEQGRGRDSSPDSPTSPDELASNNAHSKSIPIPVRRRTRPKLLKRKTLPPPPPEQMIPDGQLADAYSFGMLVLCVALGRVIEFEQPEGYSHPTARHLPYFNPPFDTTGSPAPAHLLPAELFLPQSDPSHPDSIRVKTVASRVKKWMARWDLRRALDESWAFGGSDGAPWRVLEDLDEEHDESSGDEDEDADITMRDGPCEKGLDSAEDCDEDVELGLGLEGMVAPEVGDEGYDSDDVEIHMVWG